MIYPILSLGFLVVALLVLAAALIVSRKPGLLVRRWARAVIFSGLILAVLTAVFDNLMVAGGFMSYRSTRISGIHIGLVPVEDFAYPLAALILLPALWFLTGAGSRGEGNGR